ncbi:hypothetical protein N4T77_14195 [Clostridium sp. CX1]|uniref:UvrD-helicase domain-containing protein n=1 Tax=Clostridium sp. CX1 TaxID=2978346 RepID=UPI0021C12AB5|nr:UvrD-helicase domain-containing protein [Clostridium sp. CX1]MCT8977747.1 hypothetical protein [Clostridium sp. CX1]
MIRIRYLEVENKIINDKNTEKCILINGKSASGKTTLAIKKYKYLVEKENVNTDQILVFIMNRYQGLTWKRELSLRTSSETKIFTYQGFIRKELIKYWPIVEKSCSKIKKSRVGPEFVSADTANYMMEILVDFFRSKGYLSSITSTSSRIASDLVSNINKAALSLLDIKEIGSRIYNSIEVKDGIDKETYNHMDEIIELYINRFLSQGVVDYGLSVYLYNNYLLKDTIYLQSLKKIRYLIVDDLDEASPAEIEFIYTLTESIDKAYLFTNPDGGFCSYYGADLKYVEEGLTFIDNSLNLEEHFCCKDEFITFADKINERTLNIMSRWDSKIPVSFDISSQLRSEMIEKIGDKIVELICKGKKPEEIVLMSPYNDFILSYEIESKLRGIGIGVINTSKKSRLIDNPFIHALVVIAYLCSERIESNFTIDDYRRFFNTILNLDLIKSSILSKYAVKNNMLQPLEEKVIQRIGVENAKRYNYLKNWIDKHRLYTGMEGIPLDELFRRAYLELLITVPGSRNNILVCKNLSETAEKFIGILLQFNKMDNPEQKFIDFIRSDATDFYSLRELEEIAEKANSVIITNPYNFLTSNIKSKVQILADINSNMWSPRNIKELTNSYVLRKTWSINEVYTNELEERNRQNNLVSIIKCIMRKCSEELYFYGSEYSVSGYEQQSLFSDLVMDMMNENDDMHNI